jgi:hypothetical protein
MLTWQMGYDLLEAWVAWGPDFDHTYGVGGFGKFYIRQPTYIFKVETHYYHVT